MKKRLLFAIALVTALSLVATAPVSAKAPAAGDRTGELDLSLNFGAFSPAGPYDGIIWYGTATFDHGEYGIVYRTVTTHASDVVSHWTETWEMYRPGEYKFEVTDGVLTGFVTAAAPVVEGFDKGITHWKKFMWIGNGPVGSASDDFAEWEGRRAHTKGSFNPVAGTGTGVVRFN